MQTFTYWKKKKNLHFWSMDIYFWENKNQTVTNYTEQNISCC